MSARKGCPSVSSLIQWSSKAKFPHSKSSKSVPSSINTSKFIAHSFQINKYLYDMVQTLEFQGVKPEVQITAGISSLLLCIVATVLLLPHSCKSELSTDLVRLFIQKVNTIKTSIYSSFSTTSPTSSSSTFKPGTVCHHQFYKFTQLYDD